MIRPIGCACPLVPAADKVAPAIRARSDPPEPGASRDQFLPAQASGGCAEQAGKPGVGILLAGVPAKGRLMQVTIRVLDRKPVKHANPGALERRIEAFGGVHMRGGRRVPITAGIRAPGMIDLEMRRELAANPAVRGQFIGDENRAGAVNIAEHEVRNGATAMGAALGGAGASAAFGGNNRHALARAGAAHGLIIVMVALARLSFRPLLAAKAGFIHLDDSAQKSISVIHHPADALAKKPRGLLANA